MKMTRESKNNEVEEAVLRDGSRTRLLPLENTSRNERSAISAHDSQLSPSKQDEFSPLNCLAEVADRCVRGKNQSFVNEVPSEQELVRMDDTHEQQNSMPNLLSCSYGSLQPLDVLADVAEICRKMEQSERSLHLLRGLPFFPIPKKKMSPAPRTRVEVVQKMRLQGKRVTHKRCCDYEESVEAKKEQPLTKKRNITISKLESENPPPHDLPVEFVNRVRELEGSDVKFLMQKTLFESDVSMNNTRLSMPLKQIHCEFLTESEKAILDEREGTRDRPCGIKVVVLDQCLREFNLSLKKWDMRNVSVYNLVNNWKTVITENNLKSGDQVQIWSFRDHGNLCLLLNCMK